MINRGQALILGMLLVAVLAACAAWWYQYRRGAKVLEQWGAEVAYEVRMAQDCQLWRLAPSDATQPPDVQLGDQAWIATEQVDVSDAPGFIHARQALIQDASYDWSANPSPSDGDWQFALVFTTDDQPTHLLFDIEHALVCEPKSQQASNIAPIVQGLQTFFGEQLPLP